MEYVKGRLQEKSKTILVVEDDDSIGSMLVEVLSQETPYRTMLVTDGLQALKAATLIKPCLFITDYRLPLMDGIELYDQLHSTKELQNVPTILMSAFLPEEEAKKRELVCLSKPFELDELLQKVESMLNKKDNGTNGASHSSIA